MRFDYLAIYYLTIIVCAVVDGASYDVGSLCNASVVVPRLWEGLPTRG